MEMTVPVVVVPEETAMTAAVVASLQPANSARGRLDTAAAVWTIAFVLPEGLTAETAPKPADTRVTWCDVPLRSVPVILIGRVGLDRLHGISREPLQQLQRRALAMANAFIIP